MAGKTVLAGDIETLDQVEVAVRNLAVATEAAQNLLKKSYYQQPRYVAVVAPAQAALARLKASMEKEAIPRQSS